MSEINAWEAQSKSLIEVQKKGGRLEKAVKESLGWDSGRGLYDVDNEYNLQMDNIYPNKEAPEIFASVTYTEPDTKGHSNENKLQLKVGELVLLKNCYPDCKMILILGGSQEAWLPYVLEAFEYFFDEVLTLWTDAGLKRLKEIKDNPNSITTKHTEFWNKLRAHWNEISLKPENYTPPTGLIRYKIADKIRTQTPTVDHPDLINSRIAALCMHRSKRKGGREWEHFRAQRWNAIEQSRSYFNPLEALTEISLRDANLEFQGGIAMDVPVSSLLHDLGMDNTLLSEDFVLHSKKYNVPVYIQCKASGGGRTQHGKNIQNRTKEQVTRGILYKCKVSASNELIYTKKPFIWVSVLDGDWGVTKKSPLKYIHMLQLAGYDKFFGSEELIDENIEPLPPNENPLTKFLINELDCTIRSSKYPS